MGVLLLILGPKVCNGGFVQVAGAILFGRIGLTLHINPVQVLSYRARSGEPSTPSG